MLSESQLTQFNDEGYVIIDGINASVYDEVKEAAERAVAKARRQDWPHIRQVTSDGPFDIWGVSNLLDPELDESAFGDYLATPEVLDTARVLLNDRPLRLGLTNMLVSPTNRDFAISWHRDGFDNSWSGDLELEHLRRTQDHTQWNAAIHAESCLRIVPGTHARNITDAERDVLVNRPFDAMLGELRVDLSEGQAVYYNALMLHKGDYPRNQRRLTLHANLNCCGPEDNFALHYDAVRFMEADSFREGLPAPLHPLLDNWMKFAARIIASRLESEPTGGGP
jgi:hypothetical protein